MACSSPFTVNNPSPWDMRGVTLPVPCGKCPDCVRTRISSWAFRLSQEERICKSAHFVTLTYNTEHVPISDNGYMTLDKSDLKKFWKRLRYNVRNDLFMDDNNKPIKIKYYAVGEYGSHKWRPHYHAIVFNCPSEVAFSDAWTVEGSEIVTVDVGNVTGASIRYTLKYIEKSSRVPRHANDDRVKEFSTMSNGLGKNYLTKEIKEYHKADLSRNFVTAEGGFKVAMPRYYRDKIFTAKEKRLQSVIASNKAVDFEKNLMAKFVQDYAKHGLKVTEDDFEVFKMNMFSAKQLKQNNNAKRRRDL